MAELEETREFRPRFDEHGLIGAIVTDASDNTVLMFAHMDDEALRLTRITGFAHFWSRSRGRLWKKGETSGETLRVIAILVDCDQDVLMVKVEPQGRGAACHTGRRSCFYRRVEGESLAFIDTQPLFDPAAVYKPR
jgi:phosphoribosyl-AMP cyclohydrolase